MISGSDIQLARTAVVTRRNFSQLGYERVLRGVYAPQVAAGGDTYARHRAAFETLVRGTLALFESRGAVLYGSTALQILGVALPAALEDWAHCHILIPPGTRRPDRPEVIAHHSVAAAPRWPKVSQWPVLHPVDHWLQLAAPLDQLVEVGDGLLRRSNPLVTPHAVTTRLAELAGHRGVKRVRRALRWVEPGTDSIMETRTRLVLVRAGLPRPAVNLPVLCRAVGRTYHLDMAYDKEKLGVEYDGADHVGSRRQMEIDATRRAHLQDEGWLIIPVTAPQLAHPNTIVQSVHTALVERRELRRAPW